MAIAIEELNGGQCKSYLLSASGEAALVDPLRERIDAYRALLDERRLKLRYVLETHMHADHLMLDRASLKSLGAPLLMHRASPSPLVDRHLDGGDALELGGERIEVLHTPGHTPDSVCYFFGATLLTGDTLMIGATGRCDFPGGDPGEQFDAVTQKLFPLPDATRVWPAHDYKGKTSSTIGEEQKSNPRFLGRTRAEYVQVMNGLGLPFPEKIQQALQVNQSGYEPGEVGFPGVAQVAAMQEWPAEALAEKLRGPRPPLVLDVREPEEFVGELGHIEGAMHVPLDAIEKRMARLDGEREVVVVCRAGARSATAGAMLRRAGFARVYNLRGGMLAWVEAGLPVQR